ncbi:PIR protein [Plasmodium yoelii]|uniref:PIR protein n=2 Tax=Plasmodium yoelii TaxID=5861 RepID=A0AAE9WLR8_PLAYO|nr:PIR protein [Plasmodium yoelii]WBY54860.1 PIR protein [Plasmodium yoelii yoelii]VTZ71866.1 PIR protein [Plasmodium yoelii]|eukprot:XP_022810950.2 PIR protein [Plasmodium yoelii]
MNKKVCQHFNSVWIYFPDELKNGNYNFLSNGQHFNKYCSNNSCDNNLEQINSACLYLFNALFGDYNVFKDNAKKNIDVVYYIIIWLSYMLSLKEENGINKLNDFYTEHIEKNKHYIKKIESIHEYKCYKDIIDKKKELLDMDINDNIISELYATFKSLYELYSTFSENTSNCPKFSNKANQFVEKYKVLNNNNKDSSYNKILSTLSDDYNNLIKKCKDAQGSNFPPLPEIKTIQPSVESSGDNSAEKSEQIVQNSEQTVHNFDVASSSSSIVTKLIPVVSIFAAISIFLGISYKYSLFGFRKRSQKHLREKLKK